MNFRRGWGRLNERRNILQQRKLKLLIGKLPHRRDGRWLRAAVGLIVTASLAFRADAARANASGGGGAARQGRLAEAEQQAKQYGKRNSHLVSEREFATNYIIGRTAPVCSPGFSRPALQ